MFHQNDPNAPDDFRHYACLFSSLLYSREKIDGKPYVLKEGVTIWQSARDAGIISTDINHDGDYDDIGEDEIQSFDRLIKFAKLPLREIAVTSTGLPRGFDRKGNMRILPTKTPIDPAHYWVIEAWHWKITHFVVGDGTGNRPVVYDPISGGSLTVRNGKCESLRVFEIADARA